MEINKEEKCTEEQWVRYDTNVEIIDALTGIFIRQRRVVEDERLKEIYNNRIIELGKEEQLLDCANDEMIQDVRSTYGALIREYYSIDLKDRKKMAPKGLPEKFWTTKVDFSKYLK